MPRRIPDPLNTEPYVEARKKRTVEEAQTLGLQVGEEIEKRRKYVMKHYGYQTVLDRAMAMSKKPLNEIAAEEIALARDSYIEDKLYNVTRMNKEGKEEEKIEFIDAEFDKAFSEKMATDRRLKKLEEREKEERENIILKKLQFENQEKLSEAMKQQFALTKSNWTEI
jgi:hypothetical protein